MGFLMIRLTTLYDEYIDRPKLPERKKPVEYIVPPPSRGVGTKNKGPNKDTYVHFSEKSLDLIYFLLFFVPMKRVIIFKAKLLVP